ncbi:MAG: hypothetical protein JJ921_07955 [Pseudomonadales bacterium]|nr:hypothetical protein [Pseudomonadales bacterium]MBO7007417.1 hypothetical protein [Pseudomonadales bacterium]
MHQLVSTITLTAGLLLISACDGPFGFFAGGELSGAVSEAPKTWQLAEVSGLAQLETRPDDPYSNNFTYIQMDGRLYVYAGDTRTNWVQNIEQSPLVRVKIGETIYEARAIRKNDQAEIHDFAEMWISRGAFMRDPRDFEEVWLYQLVAR